MNEKLSVKVCVEALFIYSALYYAIIAVVWIVWSFVTNDEFREHPINSIKKFYNEAMIRFRRILDRMRNKLINA